jgi:lipase ATG15
MISGKSIVYDTVSEMGWRPDVRKHPIREVITKVLEDDRDWEEGRQVPLARREEDCFVSVQG